MAESVKANLQELKAIAQEIFTLNKRLKELRLRKKELDESVIEFLESNDKNGLRLDNIVFVASEKSKSLKKKKVELISDTAEILRKYGVQNSTIPLAIEELEASRKGPKSSVPALKMKTAGLFG